MSLRHETGGRVGVWAQGRVAAQAQAATRVLADSHSRTFAHPPSAVPSAPSCRVRRLGWRGLALTVSALAALLAAPASSRAQTCAGDCNGNGAVSTDETIVDANVVLGTLNLRSCPAADVSGDGRVTVDEAVTAVGRRLAGCAAPPAGNALLAASGPAQIEVGVVAGSAGAQVTFDVTLHTMGNVVAATENVIAFDPLTPIVACEENPAIGKDIFVGFRPLGCTAGLDCTSIKVIVLSLSNLDPIADGAVLYSCRVAISFTAPDGTYPLDTSEEGASTPDGEFILTEGIDGAVVVEGAICAGDCDGSETVSINETILGLNILLGNPGVSACPAADVSGNGVVTADESAAAIGNSLDGCGTHPSGPPGGSEVQIELAVVAGQAGTQVAFGATLHTSGESVVATQNDIGFDPLTPIVSCQRNPAINKMATSFVFHPIGCIVGVDCTSVRTVVIALDDLVPIPDGSELYTCTVAISPFAPDGTYPLLASDLGASTPGGRPIAALGVDGAVLVSGGGFPPTPTPTPQIGTRIRVGDTAGVAGQTTTFGVGLETGEEVAGTENELVFDGGTPIVFSSCQVNPDINKPSSAFALRPNDCLPGINCSGVKAVIISFFDLAPIPNGSTMYFCDVFILPGAAPGDYPIDCVAPGAASPQGDAIPTECVDGRVSVLAEGPPVAPASLVLQKARLRANRSSQSDRPNGSARVSGVVNANVPFAGLTEEIIALGLSVTIAGAGGVDLTLRWEAAACASRPGARGPTIRCAAQDVAGKRRVVLRPTDVPNLLRIKVKGARLTIAGPFTTDPVTASVITTSFQRPDSIDNCELHRQGAVTKCRERGIVP